MWKLVLLNLETCVCFSKKLVHGLRRVYHSNGNGVGHIECYSYVRSIRWKLVSLNLETCVCFSTKLVHSLRRAYHSNGNGVEHTRCYS